MKHLFVPYEIAELLREKHFDEECLTYWELKDNFDPYKGFHLRAIIQTTHLNSPYPGEEFYGDFFTGYKNSVKEMFNTEIVTAPLYQQVIDWLREKHQIFISPDNRSEHKLVFVWKKDETQSIRAIGSGCNPKAALNNAIEEALKLI